MLVVVVVVISCVDVYGDVGDGVVVDDIDIVCCFSVLVVLLLVLLIVMIMLL